MGERKRVLYETSQIDLKRGEQLRITHGRRTVFIFVNARGLNISKGGYSTQPPRQPRTPPMSDPTKPPAAPESTPAQESGKPAVVIPRWLAAAAAEHHDRALSYPAVRAFRDALAASHPAPETPSREAQAPLGWRLVPVEATEAMLNAPLADQGDVDLGHMRVSGKQYESRRDLRPVIWAKMLAAAPSPPSQPSRVGSTIASALDATPLDYVNEYRQTVDGLNKVTDAQISAAAARSASQPEAASAGVREFARWIIREMCWECNRLDGGDIQDEAFRLGLVVETEYDPDIHGQEGNGATPGDTWYVFSDALSQTPGQSTQDSVSPSKEKGQAG